MAIRGPPNNVGTIGNLETVWDGLERDPMLGSGHLGLHGL